MVDVGAKPSVRRRAVARGRVRMAPETARSLTELPKGDALVTAQLAGIMAAKRTAELIPLCHPLALTHVDVSLSVVDDSVEIEAVGRDDGPDGRRDGGARRRLGGRAHRVRHGEGDRQGDGHRRGAVRREDEGARVNAAVLTVSDGVSAGVREDSSGDLLESLLREDGFEVERRVVSDDADLIASAMRELVESGVAVVLTTGGTGFAPRDVTPEATRSVVEREAPGLAEAIRADAIARTPHALLSRGIAGLRGATLIVNLPGSPGGCRDGFAVIQPGAAARSRARSGRHLDRAPADVTTGAAAAPLPRRLASLVRIEHTVFALPFAYVGAFLVARRMAGAREHGLGDGGHGRRTDARDVDQSARRCGTGCAQPAHCDPRASVGSAVARAGPRLVPLVTSRLPRRRLPARPGRPLALADSRRDVRRSTRISSGSHGCATSGSARASDLLRWARGSR